VFVLEAKTKTRGKPGRPQSLHTEEMGKATDSVRTSGGEGRAVLLSNRFEQRSIRRPGTLKRRDMSISLERGKNFPVTCD